MNRKEKYRAKRQLIVDTGELACVKCMTVKKIDDFPKTRTTRSGEPRYAYCKPCHSEFQRGARLKKWFKITVDEYEMMLNHQGGVCAICKFPPRKTRLAVDHNHKTGLLRGLLCAFCNRAVGLFRDDVERFENTVEFMKNPPATQTFGKERFGLKGRTSNKMSTVKRLNPEMLFDRPKNSKNSTSEE